MKNSNVVVTRSAAGLASALGLTPADGAEIELRSDLNSKNCGCRWEEGLDAHSGGSAGAHPADACDGDPESQHQRRFHRSAAPRTLHPRVCRQSHFPESGVMWAQ
jgi:hypothetical protein